MAVLSRLESKVPMFGCCNRPGRPPELFGKVLEEPTSDGLLTRALYDMTGLLVRKQGRIQLGRTMQW